MAGCFLPSSAPSRSQGTPRIVRSQPSQASQSTPSSQAAPPPTIAEEFDDFPMSAEEMEMAMKGVEDESSWGVKTDSI